jgi:hypothetical protein
VTTDAATLPADLDEPPAAGLVAVAWHAFHRRKDDLKLSQREVAERAAVSEYTIRLLEKAGQSSFQRSTMRSISLALDWPGDALERIQAGLPPVARKRKASA